jgi:M6 family metalloprotease-like protein
MNLPGRSITFLLLLSGLGGLAVAADPDLSDYRTVEQAVVAKIARGAGPAGATPGFLGWHVGRGGPGNLTVMEVAADSPAALSGVRPGDLVRQIDGIAVKDEYEVGEIIHARPPGTAVKLTLSRDGKPIEIKATVESASRPMAVGRQRAILGVQVDTVKDGEGVRIEQVNADTAADRAKLKVGEIILKVDDVAVPTGEKLTEILNTHKPDDQVTLTLLVADKTVETKVRLGAEASSDRPRGGFNRGGGLWTRPVFRLAIVCVEYPDIKHNPKITAEAWEDAMFSQGTYTKTNVTGQQCYGSLRDYYLEQSFGALGVEGKAFPYVEVRKKRAEYSTGNRTALLTEALDKLLERDGKDALKDFDGVFFLYAGERFQVPRGSLYWPHRANVSHNGKRWPYFICPEGGSRMANISVFCHEFGHMLGLPDLYARPENPGMEGSGVWSAMANQVGNGKPQHFCAWSKERLGWIKPTVIDPTVKQKLILGPIEDSPKECFKVLVRPDASEYLLLENRRKKGFDASLPAEGLLIWRVVGNRPILEESHGIEGAAGPRMFLTAVPYPSNANDSFTPYTIPSSRCQLGGGLPVYITNITKLPDERIAFHIGYEYH